MARLFLLPFLMALGWSVWLLYRRIPLYEGRKGFYWIIGGSGALVVFLGTMLLVTH